MKTNIQHCDGYMYFTDANTDLYRTMMVDGNMTAREKLSDSVNTSAAEYNACISPDGSFIIFTSFGWGDGFGNGDLFVSYHKDDGTWTKARNMGGGINSDGHDYCPSITPDGRFLFFASNKAGTEDLYWVDAGIVDSLRTKDLNTADMLFERIMVHGPQVTQETYEALRAEYADYCFFDGGLLAGIGDRLLGENKTAEAISVMKLGAALHPESVTYIQKLKLAVVDEDGELFNVVSGELEKKKAALGPANERQLNMLGYRLMGWQKLLEAIKIFRLNVELFPGSFNVYDSYAEALLNHGDTLASIENYERSLELNPENTNAEDILTKLRGE